MFKLKRAYDAPAKSDGRRILVERLWPRGISKQKAGLDDWIKDIAPSTELRQWYDHEIPKWPQFRKRYQAELKDKKDLLDQLRKQGRQQTVTLVYAAKDQEHNGALVLKEYLEK